MSNKTIIEIDGNNKGAITSINGVKQELGGLSNAVEGKFSQSMALLTKHLGMTAAIGGATTLGYLAKQVIDTADELFKMSQKVGVSIESLSTLKYAAELSDLSIDQMGAALKKLSSNMYDISKGVGQTVSLAFNDLGLSVTDASGKLRSTEDVLLEVADRFALMSDGTEKSALAVKLFGRAGLDLIPFLNQGRDGIKDLTDEAEKLGLKISTETGKSAERFNDTLTTFKNTLMGLVTEAMPPLLEDLNNFTTGVMDLNNAVQDFSGESLFQGLTRAIFNFNTIGVDLKGLTGIKQQIADFIRQQKELKAHTDEVNKEFYETFGVVNTIYPFLVDKTNTHNNSLSTQLTTVKKLNDEWAKYVERVAAGQPEENASAAGSVYPSFNELNTGFEMFPVDVNPFDPLTQNTVDFFDMYNERASVMRQNTSEMFGNMSNAASMFYQASGQKAKQWFAVQKAFSISQSIMNTYEGATKALAQGGFFGIAMAATVIAAGLANVAMIAAQQPTASMGGASRGYAGGSSLGSTISQPVDQGTGNYNRGLNPTYNVVRGSSGLVINNTNTYIEGSILDYARLGRDLTPHINNAIADGVS